LEPINISEQRCHYLKRIEKEKVVNNVKQMVLEEWMFLALSFFDDSTSMPAK
jgi:hypothetical protein